MRADADLYDTLVQSELSAIAMIGRECAPLTHSQAITIVCNAIWHEAIRVVETMAQSDLGPHLTVHAVRAVREAQAGAARREVLIDRIHGLPRDQQMAYSLRYEHGMSDAQIGSVLGRTEDEVVTLMLGALEALRGARSAVSH